MPLSLWTKSKRNCALLNDIFTMGKPETWAFLLTFSWVKWNWHEWVYNNLWFSAKREAYTASCSLTEGWAEWPPLRHPPSCVIVDLSPKGVGMFTDHRKIEIQRRVVMNVPVLLSARMYLPLSPCTVLMIGWLVSQYTQEMMDVAKEIITGRKAVDHQFNLCTTQRPWKEFSHCAETPLLTKKDFMPIMLERTQGLNLLFQNWLVVAGTSKIYSPMILTLAPTHGRTGQTIVKWANQIKEAVSHKDVPCCFKDDMETMIRFGTSLSMLLSKVINY